MGDVSELPSVPGIRAVSNFFSNFDGEQVVVRPSAVDQAPFKIEIVLSGQRAVFPPLAQVHAGDMVERVDPRGGVIEYVISRHEFSRDPFGHGDDHWNATLTEKGHAPRSFAQPKIIVNGGTNQISVGDANLLHQTNIAEQARELVTALEKIGESAPRDSLNADQIEELEDALDAARTAASSGAKTGAVRRSLHGLRGVVEDITDAGGAGALEAVKVWAAAATTVIIQQIAGL